MNLAYHHIPNLKKGILYFCLFLIYTNGFAQTKNKPEVIAKNNVKACRIKYCGSDGSSGCIVIDTKYDRNGNTIEWDMSRLGTIYRDVYDENNTKIMTLWVDKGDTTNIDTIMVSPSDAVGDTLNERIVTYTYDNNGFLIGQYNHFEDPCMGWDGNYLFKNQYSKNGLLKSTEALREEKILDFTISYEYEYFE